MKSLALFVSLWTCYANGFVFPKSTMQRGEVLHMDDKSTYIADSHTIQQFKTIFAKDTYSHTLNEIMQKKVSGLYINPSYNEMIVVNHESGTMSDYSQYHSVDVNPLLVNKIVDKATDANIPLYFINFNAVDMSGIQHIASDILNTISVAIPLLFVSVVLLSLLRNMNMMSNNTNNGPFGGGGLPGLSKRSIEFVKPNISISSWAGSPEVIEECKEVITYLENKEIYKQIGAEMAKGILLEGPPGTGKTLLAKAIASETDSNFISVSGSEFVELFVGMGAARVRELFDNARKNRPCIIFIDEIDAIGKQRGTTNMGTGGNDEREQTLNQLLYEMDGFNDNENILIMAATNRKDILDAALLRPGRFDKIIRIPLPDKQSRIQILQYYLKNKKVDKPVNIDSVAELADGFSGAQLKNLINEASIISAKNNYTILQEKYIFDAFEKSVVGLIRRNASVLPDTRQRVALHESGHSLLVLHFNDSFVFKKASIQPTYNGAGGYTLFSEKPEIREGGLYTKDILKKRLIISMGGKAAETLFYGNEHVSLGAIQDLQQANQLAKRMVGNFGMGKSMEVFYNENVGDNVNPYAEYSYSEHTKYMMDKECLDFVSDAFYEAKRILNEKKEELLNFTLLLENNNLVYSRDL
jgi:cell division protease FtsH